MQPSLELNYIFSIMDVPLLKIYTLPHRNYNKLKMIALIF